MRLMARNIGYKRPDSEASDKRTPTTFYSSAKESFIPTGSTEGEELFFCMAELYQSSMKDYETLDTTGLEAAVTILIYNPIPDYTPDNTHYFIVDEALYRDKRFEIQTIAPNGPGEIKIVGAAYGQYRG